VTARTSPPAPTDREHTATDSPDWFSDEVRLAVAPAATYRRLVTANAGDTASRVLARIAMPLLVTAVTLPMIAIQRVTVGLAATTAIAWAFAFAIQALVGMCVIASSRRRTMGMARALDLWFAAGFPYQVWLLVASFWALTVNGVSLDMLVASGIVPAAWTAVIVSAFCRTVLGTSVGGAHWRAAAHQAAVWAISLALVATSAGGWFQVVRAVTGYMRPAE